MRRGIFRTVAGSLLIALQIIAFVGQNYTNTHLTIDVWFLLGFFSPMITGILLLIFGINALLKKQRSTLVLHTNRNIVHTITKWIGITLSILLFISSLLAFFQARFIALFYPIVFLLFFIYALFYMYKKPSCLFSATLIFIGLIYIFEIVFFSVQHDQFFSENEYVIPVVLLYKLPKFFAGIFYISLATILHKENFSRTTVKIFGCLILTLEIKNKLIWRVASLCAFPSNPITTVTIGEVLYLLFVIILIMYLFVFKINTTRNVAISECKDNAENSTKNNTYCFPQVSQICTLDNLEKIDKEPFLYEEPYKNNEETQPDKINNTGFSQIDDRILFCRKCGKKLANGSAFCGNCGTRLVTESRFCKKCGTKLLNGSLFCGKCGTRIFD